MWLKKMDYYWSGLDRGRSRGRVAGATVDHVITYYFKLSSTRFVVIFATESSIAPSLVQYVSNAHPFAKQFFPLPLFNPAQRAHS